MFQKVNISNNISLKQEGVKNQPQGVNKKTASIFENRKPSSTGLNRGLGLNKTIKHGQEIEKNVKNKTSKGAVLSATIGGIVATTAGTCLLIGAQAPVLVAAGGVLLAAGLGYAGYTVGKGIYNHFSKD